MGPFMEMSRSSNPRDMKRTQMINLPRHSILHRRGTLHQVSKDREFEICAVGFGIL